MVIKQLNNSIKIGDGRTLNKGTVAYRLEGLSSDGIELVRFFNAGITEPIKVTSIQKDTLAFCTSFADFDAYASVFFDASSGGGGGGADTVIYNGASPTTVTVGGMPSGTAIAGLSIEEIIELTYVAFLNPAFSAFSISGQATVVELGTTLSGAKLFTWTTTNSGNVAVNSIAIRDVTNSVLIASGLANDGSQSVVLPSSITKTVQNAVHSWRGEGVNTQSNAFNSSNYNVTWRFAYWAQPVTSTPTNSAQVRALTISGFYNNGLVFTLNTGNALTRMVIIIPASAVIVSIFDLEVSTNITSTYILVDTFNVNDAGGNPNSYNVYELVLGIPYSSNHRHQVTLA